MRLHADAAQQDEDDHQWQGRHQGRQAERTGDGFQLLHVHARLPGFRHAKAISRGFRNGRVRDNGASMGVQQRM
ncbi:hypothetical protein RGQ21_47090 [Kitasatospora aureofaciens]|nr:hypothetical protein RGQ21_47090 [Kitasatospora aureofaciens]GHA87026.1 hypothetical protein GCM10010330_46730 [Streptomyces tendae]